MCVVSLPVKTLRKTPRPEDLPNLHAVLTHAEQLHCDMFEKALPPIALANKLVSLSAHLSSQNLKVGIIRIMGSDNNNGVRFQYCSVSIFSHIFSLEPRAAAQAIAARSLSPHFAQQSGCG